MMDAVNAEVSFNKPKPDKFDERALAERLQAVLGEHEITENAFEIDEIVNLIKEYALTAGEEQMGKLFSSASTLLYFVNLARKLAGEEALSPEECSKMYRPAFEYQLRDSFKMIVRDELSPIWQKISDESVQAGINFINANKDKEEFQGANKVHAISEGAQKAAFQIIDQYLLEAVERAQQTTGHIDHLLSETDYLFLVGGLKEIVGSGINLGVEQAFASKS